MNRLAPLLVFFIYLCSSLTFAQTPTTVPAAPTTVKLTIVNGTFRDTTNKEITGTGDFKPAARIWITADDAAPGKAFDQWTGDTQGLSGNSRKDPRTIVTIPTSNTTLTATYKDFPAIRIACIGDTPTDITNYPKDLGKYLNADRDSGNKKAEAYDVRNYGVPDSTIVLTDKPWVKSPKCAKALAFQPQIVIIMMGTQDTQKGKNFDKHDTFVTEYKKLVALFADLPTKPKIFICLPPPVYGKGQWGINNENLVSTIIPGIKQVAEDLHLPLIDVNTPLTNRPDLFKDNVHPGGESNIIMAGAVYQALTGKEPPVKAKSAPSATLAPSTPATAPAGPYQGKPYSGSLIQLPGTIQAEHYDIAPDNANDITFHYNGGAKKTDLRTSKDGIGLAKFGNGHVTIKGQPEDPNQVYLGWTQTGQWMKYSVHVKEAGVYQIGGHFAVAGKDAKLSFAFSPTLKTPPIILPTTAGYQPKVEVYHVWETLDNIAEINLPAGDYVLTVTLENAGGTNIDNFTFTRKP